MKYQHSLLYGSLRFHNSAADEVDIVSGREAAGLALRFANRSSQPLVRSIRPPVRSIRLKLNFLKLFFRRGSLPSPTSVLRDVFAAPASCVPAGPTNPPAPPVRFPCVVLTSESQRNTALSVILGRFVTHSTHARSVLAYFSGRLLSGHASAGASVALPPPLSRMPLWTAGSLRYQTVRRVQAWMP